MANMHLVTGYAGQEHVTAADHGAFNAALIGTGQFVLEKGKVFEAQVISNNQIRVLDGELMMQGRFVRLNPDTYVDLTIENGTQAMLRNDLIAARYTKDTNTGVESVNLVVIKGESVESNPVDPEYTEGDVAGGTATLNDFPLWRIPLDGINVGTPEMLFEPFIDSMRTLPEIREQVNNIMDDVDKKISEIDSYLKSETLSNETKTLYGLGAEAVPDDVFGVLSKRVSYSEEVPSLSDMIDKELRIVYDSTTIEEYAILEYIESTGTQYIDTGVIGRTGIEAELDWEFTAITANNGILASRASSDGRMFLVYHTTNWCYGYNTVTNSDQVATVGTRYNIHGKLLKGNQSLSINGVVVASGTSKTEYTSGCTMVLFGNNIAGTVGNIPKARLSFCKIKADGVLVRDYVAVKRISDNAIGLFDKVSQTFFGSAIDTAFVAGAETGETFKITGLTKDALYKVDESLYSLFPKDAAKIATGSYTGTGVGGSDNPCKITFDFAPKVVFYVGCCSSTLSSPLSVGNDPASVRFVMVLDAMQTTYKESHGFGCHASGAALYGKKSQDGKTIEWYNAHSTYSVGYQLNSSGYTYYFLAIG